jgi:hypothetical protein
MPVEAQRPAEDATATLARGLPTFVIHATRLFGPLVTDPSPPQTAVHAKPEPAKAAG